MIPLQYLALARKFWWAPVIALLVIALLLTRASNARHRAELSACKDKQAINLASIESLAIKLDEQSRAVEDLSAAGEAKQKEAMAALVKARQREKASQASVDALRRSAGLRRAENEPCVVSTILAGTKGL